MLTVCTGWSPSGWLEYGQRFAETFDRYWDPSVRLLVYGEEPRELCRGSEREYEFRPLEELVDLVAFRERNDTPANHGLERLPGQFWKERAVARGYNWRYDVMKFSKQCFIPLQAVLWSKPGDYVIWLDGDVVTHAPVPVNVIEQFLPADKDIAYLGRPPKHPEIGFQLYRVTPIAIAMLQAWEGLFKSDEIFTLKEWHSAFAWEAARARTMKINGRDASINLTPAGSGHVWHQSPLRAWTDHLKGERKISGRSPERR